MMDILLGGTESFPLTPQGEPSDKASAPARAPARAPELRFQLRVRFHHQQPGPGHGEVGAGAWILATVRRWLA